MKPFQIRIAGSVFCVEPLFESTQAYCAKYFADQKPDFYISIAREDLAFEQMMLDIEAQEEGMKRRKFTDPFLERAAIQRKIAVELFKQNTILLHGSTVVVDGCAYLFTASCGTGKSTHTRLWREVFGDRAVMINDDKPFIEISADAITAYGSPWSGKHGLDSNISAPLKGICILYRGDENVIRRIAPWEAKAMLYNQSYAFANPQDNERTLALLDILMDRIPLWELQCTKTRDAAVTAFQAMHAE